MGLSFFVFCLRLLLLQNHINIVYTLHSQLGFLNCSQQSILVAYHVEPVHFQGREIWG